MGKCRKKLFVFFSSPFRFWAKPGWIFSETKAILIFKQGVETFRSQSTSAKSVDQYVSESDGDNKELIEQTHTHTHLEGSASYVYNIKNANTLNGPFLCLTSQFHLAGTVLTVFLWPVIHNSRTHILGFSAMSQDGLWRTHVPVSFLHSLTFFSPVVWGPETAGNGLVTSQLKQKNSALSDKILWIVTIQ